MAIHIFALGIAAVVADDDAVWVHDWGDPEFKQVSHLVADHFPRDQEVDEAVDDEGGMRLSAVLPADYADDRLYLG